MSTANEIKKIERLGSYEFVRWIMQNDKRYIFVKICFNQYRCSKIKKKENRILLKLMGSQVQVM